MVTHALFSLPGVSIWFSGTLPEPWTMCIPQTHTGLQPPQDQSLNPSVPPGSLPSVVQPSPSKSVLENQDFLPTGPVHSLPHAWFVQSLTQTLCSSTLALRIPWPPAPCWLPHGCPITVQRQNKLSMSVPLTRGNNSSLSQPML